MRMRVYGCMSFSTTCKQKEVVHLAMMSQRGRDWHAGCKEILTGDRSLRTCVRMFLSRSSMYWLMKESAMIVCLHFVGMIGFGHKPGTQRLLSCYSDMCMR